MTHALKTLRHARATAVGGFTVLEVLVAMLLLALGVVPCLLLFSGEERESALVAQMLLVTNHLEALAGATEDAQVAGHFQHPLSEDGPRGVVIGTSEHGLTITQRLTVRPSDAVPGLVEIRAEAQWTDPSGTTRVERAQSVVRLVADPEWGSRHRIWPPARAEGAQVAAAPVAGSQEAAR